jgi:hypothetical protein
MTFSRISLAVAFSASLVVCILFFWLIPQNELLFTNWGGQLPLQTRLLFRFYPVIVLLPASVFAIWRYWPGQKRRNVIALLFGLLASLVAFGFMVWAVFAPLVSMSAAK